MSLLYLTVLSASAYTILISQADVEETTYTRSILIALAPMFTHAYL